MRSRLSRCRIIRQHLAGVTLTLAIFIFFSLDLPCTKKLETHSDNVCALFHWATFSHSLPFTSNYHHRLYLFRKDTITFSLSRTLKSFHSLPPTPFPLFLHSATLLSSYSIFPIPCLALFPLPVFTHIYSFFT
jgi:hypothetical protein